MDKYLNTREEIYMNKTVTDKVKNKKDFKSSPLVLRGINEPLQNKRGKVLICHGTGAELTFNDLVKETDNRTKKEYLKLITDGVYCYSKKFADKYMTECRRCGNYFMKEELNTGEAVFIPHNFDEFYTNGNYCWKCKEEDLRKCDVCGEYHSLNYYTFNGMVATDRDGFPVYICKKCIKEGEYMECYDCGRTFKKKNMVKVKENELTHYICEECSMYRDREFSIIKLYHYYGNNSDYGLPYLGKRIRHSTPLMGVELEIEKSKKLKNQCSINFDREAEIIMERIGKDYLVACEDGTLEDGFELISCPATLGHHLNTLMWDKGLYKAKQMNYVSHDSGNCGLHIHIDREFFRDNANGKTDEDIEKIFFVILRNNMSWMKLFSRRFDYSYCKINGCKRSDDGKGEEDDKIKGRDIKAIDKRIKDAQEENKRDRRMAVNFMNDTTIEIRLFRGTLNPTAFYAALEFVEIWSQLAKQSIDYINAANFTFDTFLDFAKRNNQGEMYREFLDYCQEKGLIDNCNTGY